MWVLFFNSLMSIIPLCAGIYVAYMAIFGFGDSGGDWLVILYRVSMLALTFYLGMVAYRQQKPLWFYLLGKEPYRITEDALIIMASLGKAYKEYKIPWKDITGFRLNKYAIIIDVKEPNKFLCDVSSRERQLMERSIQFLGTPFFLYACSRKHSKEEILSNLKRELEKHHGSFI